MLRRLLVTTVVIAVMTAILFGLPIVILSQRYLQTGHAERLTADAQRAATLLGRALENGREIEPDLIDGAVRDHLHVVVWQYGRKVFEAGAPLDPDDALVRDAAGTDGLLVQVSEPVSLVAEEVNLLRFTAFAIGLAAVLAAVAVGVGQARRLSRSLVELADVAERLGSGDPRPQGRRYGVSELDRVAEVLDNSAGRISAMLAAERQLSQDASHQLRTPLTALSMRLEEIQLSPDPETVREEAAIALAQVERLSSVVDHLLAQRRGSLGGHRVRVDVDETVDQQVAEWQPTFEAAHRGLEVTGEDHLAVTVAHGTLGQILSTLLENALHHGDGKVVIHRRRTRNGSVVLEVSDEGPGVPAALGRRIFERSVSGRSGTGLGLALARDLAENDGGRLELVSIRPAVFAVFLPRSDARAAG